MGPHSTRRALLGCASPAENRQAFVDALESAIRRSIAAATPAALVLIDLNDFSEVNGAWGLAVGDELLAATAQRIASFAAERLSPWTNGEATRAAVADLVAGLARPITLSGQPVGASARSVLIPIPAYLGVERHAHTGFREERSI